MGRRHFFERTMPKIADELARLNTTLAELVAEMKASSAQANPLRERTPAADGEPWQATLAAIARHHLRIDTFKARGADSLDVHQVGVAALRSALAAAFRAGIGASLRHLRGSVPTSEQADGSTEPR